MADYQVGKVNRPDVRLAEVVAASSAFPPFLSPFTLHVKQPYEPGEAALGTPAFAGSGQLRRGHCE